MSHKKNVYFFPLYWLFYRNPYKWFVIIPKKPCSRIPYIPQTSRDLFQCSNAYKCCIFSSSISFDAFWIAYHAWKTYIFMYPYEYILVDIDIIWKIWCTCVCSCKQHLHLLSDAVFAENHWLTQFVLQKQTQHTNPCNLNQFKGNKY